MERGLKWVFTFGKYKGLSVQAVAKFNPEYLVWCVTNLDNFDLDKEARKYGQQFLNKVKQQKYNNKEAWAWGFGKQVRQTKERFISKMIEIEMQERRKAGLY